MHCSDHQNTDSSFTFLCWHSLGTKIIRVSLVKKVAQLLLQQSAESPSNPILHSINLTILLHGVDLVCILISNQILSKRGLFLFIYLCCSQGAKWSTMKVIVICSHLHILPVFGCWLVLILWPGCSWFEQGLAVIGIPCLTSLA